jgi:hypothetical protein
MKKQFVYDPLISKRQQYLLATQVCLVCSILTRLLAHPATRVIAGARCSQNRCVSIFGRELFKIVDKIDLDDVITAGQAEE